MSDVTAPPFHKRWRKELAIVGALLVTLLAPFLLKPAQPASSASASRRLVIVTPHPERLRAEFGQAFVRHWKEKTGETVAMDWRVPGGTSEIAVMLKSEYSAAFQQYWTRKLGKEWTSATAQNFMNAKAPADDPARQAFLKSRVGIGMDVFFGGGAYDLQIQAESGTLVAENEPGTGIAELKKTHPEWFSDKGIPEMVSGEPFRDPKDRWVASCLSSFGIVFNRDVLKRLGIEKEPSQWRDLADPRLFGQLALADPGRSGTVTKAFEMLIQQEMQEAITRLTQNPGNLKTPQEIESAGIHEGWSKGLNLIQRISANSRYFADSSSKIPLDVARGDAAAGMCIDYYGRSTEEETRRPDGTSRVRFIMPVGGSSVSVDPIGMFRGAPESELATAFIEFVLSDAGQKVWSYRAGTPGGPVRSALRRLAARKDFYTPEHQAHMSDPAELPYEQAKAFTYHPEWTAAAFSTLRFLIRVMCVDTHLEQKEAWQALVRSGMPPRATQTFEELNNVRYDTAIGSITQVVRSRDKVAETRLARTLGDAFRNNYELARHLAGKGE
ncbi:ABC-type Fe3+ transport system substrate-binding protein [Prosthecobacter fusiformis]|uniref:ABC-type Fe3+ transport system substrate-binding protein n=1 Tax=Prosthecobacter fusiformis TaxID=48464 RepID=A0A4R7RJW3_9BACT|nr:extracellular solute-binding protein [Prosthecobacter fusiformis]TDU63196.1 ABC-type Fe3+ transport system substrate-binding protein [Prosthecobacter fusiformis]